MEWWTKGWRGLGKKMNGGMGGRSDEVMSEGVDARICGDLNEGIGYIV